MKAQNIFGACRDVHKHYEKLGEIGRGTYGTVYKARNVSTREIVALKRVVLHHENRDGFPVTSIREIKLLKSLKHKNIVKLLEIVVGTRRESVMLVFEYAEHDMRALIERVEFRVSEIKCLALQMIRAVSYMHRHCVVHRDLKMSNLLYNSRGELKVADFGLARKYSKKESAKTPKVVTLWYRAPEILFGSVTYDNTIDCWAMGALIGEFLLSEPLMPGKDEISQIKLTIELVGYPTRDFFHYVNHSSEDDNSLPSLKHCRNRLRNAFPKLSSQGIDLLCGLLELDPRKRLSAEDAKSHGFFNERPRTKDPVMMPTFPSTHGVKTK